ncbi:MAG: hypothetical protein AAGI69_26555 [Cyanobacteria bacterium P01_H01_bin.21]
MSSKQVYQREIEAKLETLDAQIVKMQAKAEQANAELKAKYQEQLRLLTERRETTRFKLKELKHSSEAAWETMKNGVDSAFSELQNAFDKAVAQFQ